MGLFDRHAGLLDVYRDVRTTGADPFQIRMERVLSPTEAIINGKTTLLVEASRQLDEKLYLGSRNLAGVELVLSSEVHPYDLLRYEHAVFSKEALAALQEMLKKSVSKRKAAQKEVA